MLRKYFLIWAVVLFSCQNNKASGQKTALEDTLAYSALSIPDFLTAMQRQYQRSLFQLDSLEFHDFCSLHHLQADSANFVHYSRIYFLHRIFTSKTAADGSVGEVVPIPYFWHWLNPNPRHDIIDNRTGVSLQKTKTIPEFKNYKSYADIDRTPYLYLSELFTDSARYSHPDIGSFCSFGWCSEREIAFSALMRIYGYESKVVANGNHSWSVHIIPMKATDGKVVWMEASTDNTFDVVSWSTVEKSTLVRWKTQTGNLTDAAKWYNEKASAVSEINRIKIFRISQNAFERMQNYIRLYLEKSL